MTDKRVLKIYKLLIQKAHISNAGKHVRAVEDLYASERMPMGAVSRHVYEEIFHARKFDRYGKMVANKMSAKEKMVAELQATFAAKNAEEAARQSSRKKANVVAALRTPKWKIGYKKPVFGPPGLAPSLPYVLNSEGNESFYSYDGNWKGGLMDGVGVYKFADGMLYTGGFHSNYPHGRGKAVYSSGTVYEGDWVEGYPNGEGKCVYQVGTVYDGKWKRGKRQGFGTLTYQTGSTYTGEFFNGRFEGRGEYKSKDTGLSYLGWFTNGYVTKTGTVFFPDGTKLVKEWPQGDKTLSFRRAIELIQKEKQEASDKKKALYISMYGITRQKDLQEYVQDVRADIKEERKMAKNKALDEKRRLQREARERERERRLASLVDKDGNAIEGAEDEVELLKLEVEDIKKRRAAMAGGDAYVEPPPKPPPPDE